MLLFAIFLYFGRLASASILDKGLPYDVGDFQIPLSQQQAVQDCNHTAVCKEKPRLVYNLEQLSWFIKSDCNGPQSAAAFLIPEESKVHEKQNEPETTNKPDCITEGCCNDPAKQCINDVKQDWGVCCRTCCPFAVAALVKTLEAWNKDYASNSKGFQCAT